MRAAISNQVGAAAAAAGSLTGKRFGLLVASSLVATSAVVAGALSGAGDSDALASLLARQLGAANEAPAAPASSPAPPSGGEPTASPGGAGAAGPAPSPPGAVEGPSPAPREEPATPATRPEAGPVKHVFLVSLTSPGYEAAFGAQSQMPYLATTLRPQGELLSGYTLLSEGALANGIAAISGQPPNAATDAGCPSFGDVSPSAADARGVVRGEGCIYPVETLTIADQLTPARLSWRAYVEGMVDSTGKPAECVHPDQGEPASGGVPGGYAATQNPFVYFHSLLDLGDCAANDVPIDGLIADLRKAAKTPAYSFIAPTPCDAGFAGQCAPGALEGAAAADAFLEGWVPKILASPAYEDGGVLIVAFSAIDPAAAGGQPDGERLRTGALLVSPLLAAGMTDAAPYGPYSLLRSTEDLFRLQPLALAAGAKTRSLAAGLLGESGGD